MLTRTAVGMIAGWAPNGIGPGSSLTRENVVQLCASHEEARGLIGRLARAVAEGVTQEQARTFLAEAEKWRA